MPHRELLRLQSLHRFLNIEIDTNKELTEIVKLLASVYESPLCLLTISDKKIQHFTYGIVDLKCLLAMSRPYTSLLKVNRPFILADSPDSTNFIKNAHDSKMQFFAGHVLKTHDGHKLGSLCIMDYKPKQLTSGQLDLIKVLSKRVVQIIEFAFSNRLLKDQFLKAKDSEMKLRAFFETSSSVHVLVDASMNIVDFNRNIFLFVKRMYHIEMYQGIAVDKILQGDSLENFKMSFDKALNGDTVRREREFTYNNGETIWWQINYEPGRDREGNIIAVSFMAKNITEVKRHEEQILKQNAVLKEIAFSQSHELRRPVASILGLMEVISSNYSDKLPEEIGLLKEAVLELDKEIKSNVRKASDLL